MTRNDLDQAVTDDGLRKTLETDKPAPLSDGGLLELFVICACIDDPSNTDGVRVEIEFDSNGSPTGGDFVVHSFGILHASGLGDSFLPLMAAAAQSPFTDASYIEDSEEGDPYEVLPFGIDPDDSGPATAVVQQIFDSQALRVALQESIALTVLDLESLKMVGDYCLAVLGNLAGGEAA